MLNPGNTLRRPPTPRQGAAPQTPTREARESDRCCEKLPGSGGKISGSGEAARPGRCWRCWLQVVSFLQMLAGEAEQLLPLYRTGRAGAELSGFGLAGGDGESRARRSSSHDADESRLPCAHALVRAMQQAAYQLHQAEEAAPLALAYHRAVRRYLVGWVPLLVCLLGALALPAPAPGSSGVLRVLQGALRLLCSHGVALSPCLWARSFVSIRSRDRRARRLGLLTLAHATLSALAIAAFVFASQLHIVLGAERERQSAADSAVLSGLAGLPLPAVLNASAVLDSVVDPFQRLPLVAAPVPG